MKETTFYKKANLVYKKIEVLEYRYNIPNLFLITMDRLGKNRAWAPLAEDADLMSWFFKAVDNTKKDYFKQFRRTLRLETLHPQLASYDPSKKLQAKIDIDKLLKGLTRTEQGLLLDYYGNNVPYAQLQENRTKMASWYKVKRLMTHVRKANRIESPR